MLIIIYQLLVQNSIFIYQSIQKNILFTNKQLKMLVVNKISKKIFKYIIYLHIFIFIYFTQYKKIPSYIGL
jgi:hypothetical protein